MAESPKIHTEYVNQNQSKEQDIKSRWWLTKPEEMHRHVFGVVEAIDKSQSWRTLNNIKYARLYANYEMMGFYGSMYAKQANAPLSARLTLNVVKACVDTGAAKIAKQRPRPLFLTEDGNWSLQTKAKKLTKFVEGVFDMNDAHEQGVKCFVDGEVMGTGVMKVIKDIDEGAIRLERTLTDELVVDDADGVYGKPRQMHQRKFVDKEILYAQFPKFKDKIKAAKGGKLGDSSTYSSSDQCLVVESWHLPSGPGAKDGKHTICIENATLEVNEWNKKYFPFGFFRWSPKIVGFFGSGIVEELVGIQLEINKTLRTIQQGINITCVPRVLVENSSQVNLKHISNEIGSIIKYTGAQPVFEVARALSQEVYNHLENLYQKAFEVTGISQLSAMSQKPSGLDSGRALREYQDIESERFVLVGQRYEKFYLDLAEIVVDQARDLYEAKGSLSVKVKGRKFIKTIKWNEVDLSEDQYSMKVFPTSLLPQTPQGKLQTVQELLQGGFIDKEYGLSLLDFPDIDAWVSAKTSALEDIKLMIEKMVDDGVYMAPEPYTNLEMATQMVQSAYLKAKTQQVPEERLELLRQFLDECAAMKSAAQPPPMPPQGAAPALPEAPPVSDLLPNAPMQMPVA